MPRDGDIADRRQFVKLTGAAVIAATIAGCVHDPADDMPEPGQ